MSVQVLQKIIFIYIKSFSINSWGGGEGGLTLILKTSTSMVREKHRDVLLLSLTLFPHCVICEVTLSLSPQPKHRVGESGVAQKTAG